MSTTDTPHENEPFGGDQVPAPRPQDKRQAVEDAVQLTLPGVDWSQY